MSTYESMSLILQVLVAIAAFGVLLVFHRQLRLMSRQFAAAQETSRAQSGLSLVAFLQDPKVHEARRTVRAVLSQKAMAHWTAGEKDHASRVAANYDVVGALLKAGLAPVDLIVENWGPSIIHCYETLKPWIDERRNRPDGRVTYLRNFKWLYDEAKKTS